MNKRIKLKNFIKEELESIAGNIDITVTNSGLDTMMEILFKLGRGD